MSNLEDNFKDKQPTSALLSYISNVLYDACNDAERKLLLGKDHTHEFSSMMNKCSAIAVAEKSAIKAGSFFNSPAVGLLAFPQAAIFGMLTFSFLGDGNILERSTCFFLELTNMANFENATRPTNHTYLLQCKQEIDQNLLGIIILTFSVILLVFLLTECTKKLMSLSPRLHKF